MLNSTLTEQLLKVLDWFASTVSEAEQERNPAGLPVTAPLVPEGS